MTRADLIDRLGKVLDALQVAYFDPIDGTSTHEPIDAEELLDELDRDGLEIVKK